MLKHKTYLPGRCRAFTVLVWSISQENNMIKQWTQFMNFLAESSQCGNKAKERVLSLHMLQKKYIQSCMDGLRRKDQQYDHALQT